MKKIVYIGLLILVIAVGIKVSQMYMHDTNEDSGLAFGNGRIESTQVDVVSKLPGRVSEILVKEGDMVTKGALIAKLDTLELQARLLQAQAQVEQARQSKQYALAMVTERETELRHARQILKRSKTLYVDNNIPLATLQQHQALASSAKAVLNAAKAQVTSAEAAIKAAQAQVEVIRVNMDDANLYAPISGRVLYRLVEPGEVIGSGGKVVSLLDLTDTFMTIFLPTAQAGLIAVGSEARIILDAIPDIAIPATVSFVSPKAQFTPKEIETQNEREKLMFRVKIKIDPKLLEAHIDKVKTGLHGVAYIRLDDITPWPQHLSNLPKTDKE